jgi:hypothetical protein
MIDSLRYFFVAFSLICILDENYFNIYLNSSLVYFFMFINYCHYLGFRIKNTLIYISIFTAPLKLGANGNY